MPFLAVLVQMSPVPRLRVSSLMAYPCPRACVPARPIDRLSTQGYLAPEMLQRESYNKEVDVWALGVIVFVLLCGCLPFDDDSKKLNRAGAFQVTANLLACLVAFLLA